MSIFRKVIEILLLAGSVILGVVYYAGGEMAGGEPVYTNHILIWGAILAGLAAVMALIFPLAQIIAQPKRGKGTLIGIAGLIIIGFIAYNLASAEPLNFTSPNPNNVPPILKQVGAGLISLYILIGLGIGAILFTEVSKSFK
ncbi:MAG: hypothetical protein ACLFM7_08315 [Bacteroidales bacterium]